MAANRKPLPLDPADMPPGGALPTGWSKMPPGRELRAYARRNIGLVSARVLAEQALLASEPLTPPASATERAAGERRLRERRAAIRLGVAVLAHLVVIERHARRGP